MQCITINGKRVIIAESLNGQYRLNVEGAHWGYFASPEVAMQAAIAVLQAPKFN